MNRKYVDALLSLKEYNRFSKGLFGWVGFKVKWLEFENVNRVQVRQSGHSGSSFCIALTE